MAGTVTRGWLGTRLFMVGTRFLLDTNVLSEPMRAQPNARLMKRFRDSLARSAVPAPAWHELVYGCELLAEGRRRTTLESYLEHGVLSVFPTRCRLACRPESETAERWVDSSLRRQPNCRYRSCK